MANCIDNVLSLFHEADRKAISEVFDGMKKDAQDGFLDAAGNPDAAFMKKAQERIDAYNRGAQIAEIKALQNIAKSAKNDGFVKNDEFEDSKIHGTSAKAEGVQAIFDGTNKNVDGARNSIWHRSVAMRNQLIRGFISALEDSKMPGLIDILKSGAIDKEILNEQWELANGREGGVTKNAAALEIAKARQDLQSKQLLMKNDAGAFVNDLEGRLMQRVYDREKINGVTKEQFVSDMKGWVDSDKSFQKDFHVQDADEVLGDIYDKVKAGRQDTLNLDGADSKSALRRIDSPANLARSMERGRTIHMDSADSEYAFMQKYGTGSLAEDVARSSQSTARKAALIERLGTNPELEVERLKRGMSSSDKNMIDRHMANIDGSASEPGVSTLASVGGGLRRWIDMTKLGTSVFSHINTIATRAGLIQMEGQSFMSGMADSLEHMLSSVPKDARDEALHIAGAGADAHLGQIYDRYGTTEGGAQGWFAKAHEMYFKLTGIRTMSEIHEAATTNMLAARLGYNSEKSFSQLDPAHANVMHKYGIGPVEWELLRKSADEAEDGRNYVGLDTVGAVPRADVEGIMKAGGMGTAGSDRVGKFQRDTATKLANYFSDRAAMASGRPGAFEKSALLNRGQNEDAVEGALARFFGQFKGYAFSMSSQYSKAYYHEALEGKSFLNAAQTIAPLMASMTALGYTSWAAKNLVQGRTPAVPDSFGGGVKIATESMIRGGVGGIYADYLLGDFDSRHGRSALAALAGPVVGQVSDVTDMLTQARQAAEDGNMSKGKAAASALGRFVSNNTIGNTPVLRQGMDYLFLNSLAESMNPGYLERQKTRLDQQGIGETFGGQQFGQ